ncbi:OmpA family protein [Sphingomonas sp.]|uniref:OmpA family protein n=1 Tax=Sphingomonas sp. TaxID=28214 RepID=UPI002DD667E4|nr:OmpA family protein [Sphingomonas sp.]
MPTTSFTRAAILLATVALPVAGAAHAQDQAQSDQTVVVTAPPEPIPAAITAGPEIRGIISARNDNRIKVTAADGTSTVVALTEATRVKATAGLFGARGGKPGTDALINGIPVTVKTLQSGGGELIASQVSFQNKDLKIAAMIRGATDQRFEEQTAATESLRGRLGDIDKYNVKATTNVHFEVGKADLSAEDKAMLCQAASQANATENALMLVVGYTDSTGSEDVNQTLSEKRAARVINHLQQACGWKPYRMLTPAGMATADPLASNDTPEGKAQNRRVAVNVLVSKSVDVM